MLPGGGAGVTPVYLELEDGVTPVYLNPCLVGGKTKLLQPEEAFIFQLQLSSLALDL